MNTRAETAPTSRGPKIDPLTAEWERRLRNNPDPTRPVLTTDRERDILGRSISLVPPRLDESDDDDGLGLAGKRARLRDDVDATGARQEFTRQVGALLAEGLDIEAIAAAAVIGYDNNSGIGRLVRDAWGGPSVSGRFRRATPHQRMTELRFHEEHANDSSYRTFDGRAVYASRNEKFAWLRHLVARVATDRSIRPDPPDSVVRRTSCKLSECPHRRWQIP